MDGMDSSILKWSYSPAVVAASVAISMVAAYAAFSLSDRMRSAQTVGSRRMWLMGGATAMGMGIWSMHYLGMLAVRMDMPVAYFVPTVVVSLVLAVGAAAVALLMVSARRMTWKRLMAGGTLMGVGIGGMHYVGMAAMRMSATQTYDPVIVAASVLVAVGLSTLALWLGFALNNQQRHSDRERLLGGAVMGAGIAAMHYTAMAAVSFHANAMEFSTAWTVQIGSLGMVAIGMATAFILAVALGSAALDRRQFQALQTAQQSLLQAQQDLLRQQRELMESQQQLVEANALLNELSIRDGLTGLHNRRHFDAMFTTEWKRAVRRQRPVALLMIDVDCFKALNDAQGHQRGDACLRELARVLDARPRRGHDVVARYGGEEFAVLLPGADVSAAKQIAEMLRRAVEEHELEHGSSNVASVVTVSIGVCSRVPGIGEMPEQMLRDADSALYAAKQNGRNRVETAPKVALPLAGVLAEAGATDAVRYTS